MVIVRMNNGQLASENHWSIEGRRLDGEEEEEEKGRNCLISFVIHKGILDFSRLILLSY